MRTQHEIPESELTPALRARRKYQREYQRKRRLDESFREHGRRLARKKWASLSAEAKLADNRHNYALKLRRDPLYNVKRQAKRYGLTHTQFAAILAAQGGGCAICGESKHLRIDHCHKTGVVRGVLCQRHNSGIGLLGDDVGGLVGALNYLLRVQNEQR